MTTQTAELQQLACLLEAERKAHGLPVEAVQAILSHRDRSDRPRGSDTASLLKAAGLDVNGGRDVPLGGPVRDILQTIQSIPAARLRRGPVLLVCESHSWQPSLASLADCLAARIIAALSHLQIECWMLRLARRNAALLRRLLDRLPAKPAAIAAMDLAAPPLVSVFRSCSPTLTVAAKYSSAGELPCVEHDWQAEAAHIASFAVACSAERINFIGAIEKVAGKRRIPSSHARLLHELSIAAQSRFVIAPGRFTLWADSPGSLPAMLAETVCKVPDPTLLIVWGSALAAVAASALQRDEKIRVLCRHWSAAGDQIPTIGPDLDSLAAAAVGRLVIPDLFPPNAALIVPPKWYRRV